MEIKMSNTETKLSPELYDKLAYALTVDMTKGMKKAKQTKGHIDPDYPVVEIEEVLGILKNFFDDQRIQRWFVEQA